MDHVPLFTFGVGGDRKLGGQFEPQEILHNMARTNQSAKRAIVALLMMKI